jgi:hypothetical protein
MMDLAAAYQAAKRFREAEPLLREALAVLRKTKDGAESVASASLLAMLGLGLLKGERYTDAEPVLRECLAIRTKKMPDNWLTFNTRSSLGGALLGQKKYAEAEPLLVDGYQGMKKQEMKIPPGGKVRLIEALERLVQLDEATRNTKRAAQWRKALEQARKTAKQPPAKGR